MPRPPSTVAHAFRVRGSPRGRIGAFQCFARPRRTLGATGGRADDRENFDMSRKVSRSASVWRSYRAQYVAEHPGVSASRLALKLARERLKLREVRNSTFQDISEAGYDVRTIEDGAKPFVPAPGEMPEHWKRPMETIVPKVARLRNAELFRDGSVLLPDGRYCYYDTCFLSHLEDDRNFGALRKVVPRDKALSGLRPVMLDMFRRTPSASLSGKGASASGTFSLGRPCISFDPAAIDAQGGKATNPRQTGSADSAAAIARDSGTFAADIPADSDVVYFRPPDIGRRVLQVLDPGTGKALIRRSRKAAVAVSGRCFSTRSSIPDNMGHFIHDMLSRIYYEDLGVIAPGRERIIAPRFAFPMQRILFERIFEGYEIVHVASDVPLRVEELLVPANLCSQCRFNAPAIAALAKRMRRIAAPFSGKGKLRICVSRRDASKGGALGRDFVNVEDCENRMRKMGYRLVEISKIDPDAQFRIWANCADIVGIHGAGMMNMLMMPEGSKYTEIAGAPVDIIPVKHAPTSIGRCAMAAGHDVGALSGDLDREGRPAIDIERLEAIILRAS